MEEILSDLSSHSKVPGTVSINDVAHAFFLLSAFVVYPSNYANVRFDSP